MQKFIDKYDWNGAMMLFSGIVLFIVAFGALFREVEWDEEDYEEEQEEEGEQEETENGNESNSTNVAPSSLPTELPVETSHSPLADQTPEPAAVRASSNTPPPTHKASFTDDLVFYDQYTKQELLDQYSKSELCLPSAVREQLQNEYHPHLLELEREHEQEEEQQQRHFPEQKLSSSTTQIEPTDELHRAAEVPPLAERSNSCK